MPLTQLIYFSRRTRFSDGAQLALLRSVLSVSQHNNARDELTGFLILDDVWFVQVIEGERERLLATYGRIQGDPRHEGITLIGLREMKARSFPRWSMGGALRTVDQREIYLRHGVSEGIDPLHLTAPTILALSMDLQDHQIAGQARIRVAS